MQAQHINGTAVPEKVTKENWKQNVRIMKYYGEIERIEERQSIVEDREGGEKIIKKECSKVGIGIGIAMIVAQVVGIFSFYKSICKNNQNSDYLTAVSYTFIIKYKI